MKNAITLCLLFCCVFAMSQSKQDKELLKLVDQAVAEEYQQVAPGCVLLIAKKGQVIYERGFGSANVELNVPMQPDMVFRIGSITKQFTAVAVLQLIEKGRISLNDSIQQYLGNFHFKGKTISTYHLLTQEEPVEFVRVE